MVADQWLFLPSHLGDTPAVSVDKQSVHHELKRRNAGVEFLFRVGLQLKLNIPVLATAATFFHRFYIRQSIDGHVIYDVAGACIFLSCKVEESGRKLKDVAAVCQAKAAGGQIISNEADPAIVSWMKTITGYEEHLLETLCFDLTVEHPHNYLLSAAESLQASEFLLGSAWSVLNDTFRTPLCVFYTARVIACASYILCLHNMTPEYPLSSFTEDSYAASIYDAFGLHSSDEPKHIPQVLALLLDFYTHIQPLVPAKLWRSNPFAQTSYDIPALYTYQNPSTETTSTTASPTAGDNSPNTTV